MFLQKTLVKRTRDAGTHKVYKEKELVRTLKRNNADAFLLAKLH